MRIIYEAAPLKIIDLSNKTFKTRFQSTRLLRLTSSRTKSNQQPSNDSGIMGISIIQNKTLPSGVYAQWRRPVIPPMCLKITCKSRGRM